MKKKCTIVANGNISSNYDYNNKFLVVCDGAYNVLMSRNILPNVVIGDMDSISILEDNILKIKVNCQESNDLQKAFIWALLNDYDDIEIIGATGKREDHTLLNIALMIKFKQIIEKLQNNINLEEIYGIYDKSKIKRINTVDFRIVTDYGIFYVFKGSFRLETYVGQQISLFSIDSNASFSSKNLKYPLKNMKLGVFVDGALNEALENYIEVYTDEKNYLIVFANY